jgi:hypothetical protein
MMAGGIPPSRVSTMIKVTKLKCLGGYRLHAMFNDRTSGEHDFSALVAKSPSGDFRPDCIVF